ncbi:MAG: hypothetical protein HRU46_15125 [Verrucomicrobiales bacterium]|nr:hypothetical protein [Verrucomicrobiales bacterium]
MEIKDIKDVLSFAAFRPEADNPRFAWPARFPKKKSTLINISRGQVSWCSINKKGKTDDIGVADGEFSDVAAQMGGHWASLTEDGWLGISVNNRFLISLEHNLSRKKGWDEELRQNPKSILGTKHDRSKRYALHHNPETSASLMMACDDSMIKSIEETMRTHNLKPARICVGLFAMTARLLNQIHTDNSLKSQDLIVLTWLDNSLCVIRQKNGQWQDLRCRSGLAPGGESTVSQMLRPFLDAAAPTTRVLLMEDKKQGEFTRSYLPILGGLHVTDVTDENNLWNILGNH